MPPKLPLCAACAALLSIFYSPGAQATFHLMQIHKVVAGVNGFTGVQVIQLRMRGAGETEVSLARLRVYDAAGQNPIVLSDPTVDVAGAGTGTKILFATANFSSFTTPPTAPDFVFENVIPDSYLAAGCLAWESDAGGVMWRLCWGAYTGDTTGGAGLNDDDGDFGPPWVGPLPSIGLEAVRFKGTAFDRSTTNESDYEIAPGAATFTTNAGVACTLIAPPTSVGPLVAREAVLSDVIARPNPFRSIARVAFRLSTPARVHFTVSDVHGRNLAGRDAVLAAGARTLEWAGTDAEGRPLPAGVYFYRLEAEGAARTGRLVLVR